MVPGAVTQVQASRPPPSEGSSWRKRLQLPVKSLGDPGSREAGVRLPAAFGGAGRLAWPRPRPLGSLRVPTRTGLSDSLYLEARRPLCGRDTVPREPHGRG